MIQVNKIRDKKTHKISMISIIDRNRATTLGYLAFIKTVKLARTQNNPALYDLSNPSSASWWAHNFIKGTTVHIANESDLLKVSDAIQDFMCDYWEEIAVDAVCKY